MLLAGGDLMASFGHPGVWTSEDVCNKILEIIIIYSLFLLSCITLLEDMVVLSLRERVQMCMDSYFHMIFYISTG